MDGNPLHHNHNILLRHLLGLNLYLQCAQGCLIMKHVGEVMVDIRRDRKEKYCIHTQANNKGYTELFGTKLTYLLCIYQVDKNKALSEVWRNLASITNRQHIVTLHCGFDDTYHHPRVCMPTIATLGLLKMTLYLGFHLYHHEDLGTRLHQLCLCHNTYATHNLPKSCDEQHQVTTMGSGDPILVDSALIMTSNGFALPKTFTMAWSSHATLQIVLDALLGWEHTATQSFAIFSQALNYW